MSDYKFPPDTLVQFTVTTFIEPDNIIFAGMYGVVVDDPYVRFTCTPGVSTFIQVLGRPEPYGYFDENFEGVVEEPDEEDFAASVYVAQNAFDIFEEEYGYTGFVKLGKKIHPQEKFFEEMNHLSGKIIEWKNDTKYSPQIDGNLKRFRKILKAFKNHPLSSKAEALSEKLMKVDSSSSDIDKWMDEVIKWVSEARKTDRKETQSDRMKRAKKEGNFETIPFSKSD